MNDIGSTIATLGTYIALMAVLAIMVEAVISWLKIPGNSPLKGKPSPEAILNDVKIWLKNDEATLQEGRIDALNKALTSVGSTIDKLTITSSTSQIATAASNATANYFQNEQKRRGIIRLIAIIAGIFFAFSFQIDTFEILGDLTAPVQKLLGASAPIVGMMLSGFSASAGSSFWHDQSAKLRSIKDAQESVSELMKP